MKELRHEVTLPGLPTSEIDTAQPEKNGQATRST